MKFVIWILSASVIIIAGLIIQMEEKGELIAGSFERVYNSDSIEIIKKILYNDYISDVKFFNSTAYIEDFGRKKILKTTSFERFESILHPKNPELHFLHEWDVDSSFLYIIDPSLKKIFYLDDKGIIKEREVPFEVVRGRHLANGKFLLKVSNYNNLIAKTKTDELFITYDLKSNLYDVNNYPLPDYHDPDFTLDGFMIRGTDRLFYICYKTGYFFCTDLDGRFLYSNNTIDKTGPPTIIKNGSRKKYAPKSPTINFSAFTLGEKLFILSGAKSKNDLEPLTPPYDILDVYSCIDGRYLTSLKIPLYMDDRIYKIAGTSTGFLAAYKNILVKYKIK